MNYEQLELEADAEHKALYGVGDESPDESGTESQIEETDPDTGTIESSTETETKESTVAESRYKDAVRAMNAAQQEAAELRKLTSTLEQLQADNAQLRQLIEQQQSKANVGDETPDNSLDELKDLYPELVTPILKRNESLEKKIELLEKRLSVVTDEIDGVKTVTDQYQQSSAEIAQEQYWNSIRQAYPDVQDIADSPEYGSWYEQQPPMIKQALVSTNAQDVIAALSLFRPAEKITTVPQSNKQDKLEAAKKAASPQIKVAQTIEQPTKFTEQQIAAMSMKEFMKHEAEIDAALANGEIY